MKRFSKREENMRNTRNRILKMLGKSQKRYRKVENEPKRKRVEQSICQNVISGDDMIRASIKQNFKDLIKNTIRDVKDVTLNHKKMGKIKSKNQSRRAIEKRDYASYKKNQNNLKLNYFLQNISSNGKTVDFKMRYAKEQKSTKFGHLSRVNMFAGTQPFNTVICPKSISSRIMKTDNPPIASTLVLTSQRQRDFSVKRKGSRKIHSHSVNIKRHKNTPSLQYTESRKKELKLKKNISDSPKKSISNQRSKKNCLI
jgi:hypothetical protein